MLYSLSLGLAVAYFSYTILTDKNSKLISKTLSWVAIGAFLTAFILKNFFLK